MQHVELVVVASLPDALEHFHMQRIGITNRSVKAQRFRPAGVQFGGGLRVAAGEQRDLVSLGDELLSQPMDDAFSATIKLGWDGFSQRSHLRNAHRYISCMAGELCSQAIWH